MTWRMLWIDFSCRHWLKTSLSQCQTVPRPDQSCLEQNKGWLWCTMADTNAFINNADSPLCRKDLTEPKEERGSGAPIFKVPLWKKLGSSFSSHSALPEWLLKDFVLTARKWSTKMIYAAGVKPHISSLSDMTLTTRSAVSPCYNCEPLLYSSVLENHGGFAAACRALGLLGWRIWCLGLACLTGFGSQCNVIMNAHGKGVTGLWLPTSWLK